MRFVHSYRLPLRHTWDGGTGSRDKAPSERLASELVCTEAELDCIANVEALAVAALLMSGSAHPW